MICKLTNVSFREEQKELEQVSPPRIVSISAPEDPVWRVGRTPDPFQPPNWIYALSDGTFGNRYDDGTGRKRFRTIYCASEPVGAYGESIAKFRPSVKLIAALWNEVDDDEPVWPQLTDNYIPAEWHMVRCLGQTILHPSLNFAELAAPESVQALRASPIIAAAADDLRIPDIDYAAIYGPNRTFTQRIASFIYNQMDDGQPRFAGIHYISRLNPAWGCWAVFDDRMRHNPSPPRTISADNSDLIKAASLLGLNIELSPDEPPGGAD